MPESPFANDDLDRVAHEYLRRVSESAPPHLADDAVRYAVSRRRRFGAAALLRRNRNRRCERGGCGCRARAAQLDHQTAGGDPTNCGGALPDPIACSYAEPRLAAFVPFR